MDKWTKSRAIYRAITKSNRAIYRAIYRTITKWTNGQNLGRYITKITKTGNIGHNNDINWSDQ